MDKPKHTQMEVAEYLDYIDNMNDLEMQRQLAIHDRQEKHIRWATNAIMVLTIAVVIVATYQLVKG